MKYLTPFLIALTLCRMGLALAETKSCRVSADCADSGYACVMDDQSNEIGVCMDEETVERLYPNVESDEPEIDYEHTGADREYHHGAHCIDGRSF